MLLEAGVKKGKEITLYNNPDGKTSGKIGPITDYYSWARITVNEDLDAQLCVYNFDNKNWGDITLEWFDDDKKLEGKVSRVITK